MKLLASVESTTILIDNQLCVRERADWHLQNGILRQEPLFLPPISLLPAILLTRLPDVDPLKIYTVCNRSHRCNYQSGSPQ